MPFKPPELVKCPKCGTSVYAAEEKLAGGKKFHKMCFKCGMCNKLLESTNVAEHEGALFCKQCHGRKFGPKGYGFGGGAGALGMDSGAQFGNTECEMSNKPTQTHVGPSAGGTDGDRCPRCSQRVYDAEKAIGANVPWHKKCFNCKDCHKALDSTTASDHDGEVYCKTCYGRSFGPKGFGFGVGAGALHD